MSSRHLVLVLVVGIAGAAAGWFTRGLQAPDAPEAREVAANSPCPGGVAPSHWKAPMDPTYVRTAPGKSPMGMDLVPVCPGTAESREGAISIDPQVAQNIGVRTGVVVRRDLARAIRAVGRVAYDERRVEHVHTKVQGWVESLRVDFVGQRVRRGEPLLEVYSPELVATQEELLLAARYRESTQASSFPDVRAGGESLYQATRRRLRLWDISERDVQQLIETGQIQKKLTLYAPASGVVTELGVRAGMEIKPNENLYTIADLSKVWVLADVYEYELPWLALGQTGTVELSYLPGRTFSGPITYIAPFLDPETRTAEVRIELDNDEGLLRPEMFGEVLIAAAPREAVLTVPSEAVIRSGRRSLVVLAAGGGRFVPRPVVLGLDSGDGWVEITEGLAPGDEIVLSSQFLLDSESNLQEAVRKLLAATAGSESARSMGHEKHDSGSMGHEKHESGSMGHEKHESGSMGHEMHEHGEH